MPQYVQINRQPKWWERTANQVGNFLWQMTMADMARQSRMEEAERERQFRAEERDKDLHANMALQGYTEVPVAQAGMQTSVGPALSRQPEGVVGVRGKYFKKSEQETTAQKVVVDGKHIGYMVGTQFVKDLPSDTKGPYEVGKMYPFEVGDRKVTLEYTGNPKDMFEGKPGFKEAFSAPRYKQDTNVYIDMTKKTQGDLEEKIVEGEFLMDKLGRIGKKYRPEFLEYKGQGTAWLENKLSKFGSNVSEFTKERNKWKAEVESHTLLWRKYITGVAGGEKEMEKIERSTINVEYDSPAEFEAKQEQIKIMTKAQMERARYLLSKGLDIQKMPKKDRVKVLESYPLEDFGYKDILPEKDGNYEKGKLYENAKGEQMRWNGTDWEKP